MEYFAQNKQDLIVLKYLENKKNGYFLDIGCGYPLTINNTYLLEKKFDWEGISIDIHDYKEPDGQTWYDLRRTKQILANALDIDYLEILKENNAPKVIDFLTMDLEPPDLTLECLFKIPFDKYSFNLILFEIDDEREPNFQKRKKESRSYLKENGYKFLGNIVGQDDIYIHESIDKNINFFESMLEINIPEHIIKHFN
jgi:SAM-dependent methyltransferase